MAYKGIAQQSSQRTGPFSQLEPATDHPQSLSAVVLLFASIAYLPCQCLPVVIGRKLPTRGGTSRGPE